MLAGIQHNRCDFNCNSPAIGYIYHLKPEGGRGMRFICQAHLQVAIYTMTAQTPIP